MIDRLIRLYRLESTLADDEGGAEDEDEDENKVPLGSTVAWDGLLQLAERNGKKNMKKGDSGILICVCNIYSNFTIC